MWTTPRTWVAAETLTAALMNAHMRDNWNAAFPPGSLHWRMQSETSVETLVDGFGLEANGYAVSRTTYSDLQTKMSGLGYPFGSGNGTTTMNLPDLRGRIAVMCGSHADVDIGDNEGGTGTGGVAEANRSPKHNSSDSLSVGGGPFVKTVTPSTTTDTDNAGSDPNSSPLDGISTTTGNPTVSGSVGPGGTRPIDTPAFLAFGIQVVKT